MSSSVLVSVAATMQEIGEIPACRAKAGSPARRPARPSRRAPRPPAPPACGRRSVNSLKKLSLTQRHARAAAPAGRRAPRAPAWLSAASRVKPCLAEQRQVDGEGERAEAGIGADVARRLLAADVLLARRQRQHEAAPPVRVHASRRPAGPASGARISRALANRPTYGPPKFSALPIDWPSAATMSAPISPGGLTSPSETDLGHDHDQQRAGAMARLGQRREVAHAGRSSRDSARRRRRCRRRRARRDPLRAADRDRARAMAKPPRARIGLGGLAVVRMQTRRRGSPSRGG